MAAECRTAGRRRETQEISLVLPAGKKVCVGGARPLLHCMAWTSPGHGRLGIVSSKCPEGGSPGCHVPSLHIL
ncbi:hypothetical protein BRADI_4g10393v3 [Brachypodium distachyon]|uniref:Uncharacterized protein n=1 Tax=Brachypodium distachyon TaxID=15368 RepID=A0A2K2CLU5_BRADI|nr:hypothetical protein BRADI_4g10393v3 [Brachypodium distachyon]